MGLADYILLASSKKRRKFTQQALAGAARMTLVMATDSGCGALHPARHQR